MRIIVNPALHYLVYHSAYVLQGIISFHLYLPRPDLLFHNGFSLLANSRRESHEEFAFPAFIEPGSECVPKKCELCAHKGLLSSVILTVYNSCLFSIQLKSKLPESLHQLVLNKDRLFIRLAVQYTIIGITLPPYIGVRLCHVIIKCIV